MDHVGYGRSGEWSQKVLQSEHIILGSRRVVVVFEGEEYRDCPGYVTEYSEVSTHGDEVVDGAGDCEREVVCSMWASRCGDGAIDPKRATHRLRIESRGIT